MSELYESDEKMLKAFSKLSPEYQQKVERQMKDLLKIQRVEQKVAAEIYRIEVQRKKSGEEKSCSFCGNSVNEVEYLITGAGHYICDECVDLCNQIIQEAREKK